MARCAAFSFFSYFLLQTANAAEHAYFIFVNGNIHTLNERQRHAETVDGACAWQSFLKSGMCGGSDAPVERGEPMIEFYAAISRKSVKGFSGEGWHPEQAVSREDALKMFTLWPAYAAFEENDKGSIEVGKLADFTVLSQDIMKIPEPELLNSALS
jgi:predicted amidohydrolase YtcJ